MKTLYIFADQHIAEALKKELLLYFNNIVLNPDKLELTNMLKDSIVLDLVNFTSVKDEQILHHNTIALQDILIAASKSGSKVLFGYHIKEKTNTNSFINLAKSLITEFANFNQLSFHFLELADVFGPKINTTKILKDHAFNILNSSSVIVQNDTSLFYAVFEEDFYEGVLNFIINELNANSSATRVYTLIPNSPITEIELAHFIKELIDANIQIKYREQFESVKQQDLVVEPDGIAWLDKVSLEEALKATLLALDIPLKMGPNFKSSEIVDAQPLPVIAPKPFTIPIKEIETTVVQQFVPIRVDLEERKNVSKIHLEELESIEESKKAINSKIDIEEVEKIKRRLQEVRLREEKAAREKLIKTTKEKQSESQRKTKPKSKPGRFRTSTTLVILGLFFSIFMLLFSTLRFYYNLYSASNYLNKSLDYLKHESYKEAYDYSDNSVKYLDGLEVPWTFNIFSGNEKKSNEDNLPLGFMLKTAGIIKNIAYLNQQMALNIKLQKDSNVLGLTSKETTKAYIDRTIELLDILDKEKQNINDSTYRDNPIFKYTISQIDQNKTYLVRLKNLLGILPDLAGNTKPLKYLLILQDPSDIKPSGGKIAYTAELEIKDGIIKVNNIKSSSDLDKLIIEKNIKFIPPLPVRKAYNTDKLLFTQANFNIDFNEAAVNIINIYKTINDIHVDGILALNYSFFVDLDKDYADSKGIFSKSEQAKDLINRVVDGYNKDNISTGFLIRELEEKNMIVYSDISNLNSSFIKNNWGNSIVSDGDDYVYVIDTNMDDNKISDQISKHIYLELNKKDNALIRNLIIDYKNLIKAENSQVDMSNTSINHLRVLLPSDIKLISADLKNDGITSSIIRNVDIYPFKDKTVIAFDTNVKPGQETKINFVYGSKLKKDIKSANVYIQKEPGSNAAFTAFIRKNLLNPSDKFSDDYIKTEYENRIGLTKLLKSDIEVEIPL